MKASNACRRQGWTLVELLVASVLVLLVLSLLLPVFSKVSEAAKASSCAGNMRAYGTAVLAFVADNNGTLPDRRTEVANKPDLRFGSWVQPYIGRPMSEFRCPNATAAERRLSGGFGYTGNGGLTEWFPSLKDIPAPLGRVVLAGEMYSWVDGFWVSGHFNRTVWGNGNGGASPDDEGSARRPQYHGSYKDRGLHLFFLDGHVERVSAPGNDWGKGPTLGNATNGGYFFTTSQFSSLKRRTMVVRY